LDEAAAKRLITADTQLWREGHTTPILAGDLYPELQPTLAVPAPPPQPVSQPSRFQQDIEHFASNPIDYVVSGPRRPDYKTQKVSAGWKVLYLLILLGGGSFAVFLHGWNFVSSARRGIDEESLGLFGAFFLLTFAGLFALAGALFQWRLFFESRKAKGARDLLGDAGARYFYVALGSLFVAVPCLISVRSVLSTQARAGVQAQQVRDRFKAESQPRMWTLVRSREVEQFRGKLHHLSRTGATISTDTGTIGGRFAEFAQADREFLRDIFNSRGESVPPTLLESRDVASGTDAPSARSGSGGARPVGNAGNRTNRNQRGSNVASGFNRPGVSPVSAANHGQPEIDPAPTVNLIKEPLPVGRAMSAVLSAGSPPLAYTLDRDKDVLRVFNLQNGEQVREAKIETGGTIDGHLVAGAPGGLRVVVSRTSHNRKKLFAWTLGAPPRMELEWQPHGENNVDWSRFISANQLLTWTSKGNLKLWSLPGSNPVYEINCPSVPVVTPGGRYLALPTTGFVQFLDVSTGRPVGSLRLGSEAVVKSLAISRDGRRLMAVRGSGLCCWDLQTGQELFTAVLPRDFRVPTSDRFQWLHPEYALCGDYVISVKEQQLIWSFRGRKPGLSGGLDDRLWYTASLPDFYLVLTPTTIPDDELVAKFDTSGRPKQLLKPGDRLSLDVQFRAAPPTKEDREKFQTLIEQKGVEAGLTFVPRQPRTVRVTIQDVDEGGAVPFAIATQREMKYVRAKSETIQKVINVPNKSLSCEVQILDERGQPIWKQELRGTLGSIPSEELGVFDKPDVTWILNKRWPVLERMLNHVLQFESEIWSFDAVGESMVAVSLSDDHREKFQKERRQAHLDAVERKKPKIHLAWKPEKVAWRVEPDPHPALNGPMMRRTLPIAAGEVKDVKFAAHAAHAVVQIEEAEEEGKPFLHRFSLPDKQLLARTPLPEGASLLDFRPDGKVWLLWPGKGESKVQVWRCGEEVDTPLAEIALPEERYLKQVMFVGRSGLFVFTGNEIFARRLPNGELIYRHELKSDQCWLSWGRKYFVDWAGHRPGLYQTADGELAGQLEALAVKGGRMTAAAFHPDGRSLAILFSYKEYNQQAVGVWNLQDGSLVTWFQVPRADTVMHWSSPKHLLIGNRLVDVEREAEVWSYASFLRDSPDGRGWYIATGRNGIVHLAAIACPSEFVMNALGKIDTNMSGLLRSSGEILNLEIALASDLRRPELTNRLTKLFTEKLAKHGHSVQPGQRMTLRISVDRSSSQRAKQYLLQNGDAELIVPNWQYHASIELKVNSGWQKKISLDLPSIDYVVDSSLPDPAANLLRQQEDALFDMLEKLRIPDLSLPTPRLDTFGSSVYGVNGERTSVNTSYRMYLD
jgi:hypothetical protein